MCGRYSLEFDEDNIYERFAVKNRIPFTSNYNAAPGQYLPVVTRNSPNILQIMRWGLIPSWAKDASIGYRMINARAETVTEKPAYRAAFKQCRCLVPATGFYEWKKDGSEKTPYYFKTGKVFAFAGLYEVNEQVEGEPLFSYTILTTKANVVVADVHERMPVILEKDDEKIWLDSQSSETDLLNVLLPYQEEMTTYEVSKAVNRASNNSEDLILPVSLT